MAVLYDHLTSLVMAGTIILMLGGLQLRGQRVATERTMMYTAKKQILSLADVLERDLENIGYGGAPGTEAVETLQTATIGGVEVVTEFAFWGRGGDGSRTKIRYTVEQVDTVTLGGGRAVPLFQWRREEGGAPDGQSSSTLVGFYIELQDNSGTALSGGDVSEARQLRVRVVNGVAPGGGTRFLVGHRRLYWEIVLRPPGMSSRSANS